MNSKCLLLQSSVKTLDMQIFLPEDVIQQRTLIYYVIYLTTTDKKIKNLINRNDYDFMYIAPGKCQILSLFKSKGQTNQCYFFQLYVMIQTICYLIAELHKY